LSKLGASSAADCLTEFSQLIDHAWYLPLKSTKGTVVVNNVPNFVECVKGCERDSECQFVTYNYVTKSCTVRNREVVVEVG
jgi:hypothetical protein